MNSNENLSHLIAREHEDNMPSLGSFKVLLDLWNPTREK